MYIWACSLIQHYVVPTNQVQSMEYEQLFNVDDQSKSSLFFNFIEKPVKFFFFAIEHLKFAMPIPYQLSGRLMQRRIQGCKRTPLSPTINLSETLANTAAHSSLCGLALAIFCAIISTGTFLLEVLDLLLQLAK